MKKDDCEECDALWKRYSETVMEHIQISSKLQVATLSHDSEALKTLEALAQTAEQARKSARHDILAHEALAHPEGPASNPDEQSENVPDQ
jgi:hypothetical protein